MGFAAHVPHYLAQAQYPRAALVLLQALCTSTGLALPLDELRDAAEESDADISIQVATNPENLEAVQALETQYDEVMSGRAEAGRHPRRVSTDVDIAAQVEAFLAELEQGDGQ